MHVSHKLFGGGFILALCGFTECLGSMYERWIPRLLGASYVFDFS